MDCLQRTLRLSPRRRGFHLITREVVDALPELRSVEIGMLHVFIQHTSASLTINENAAPEVRSDLEKWMSSAVPESFPFQHTAEGPDDMPAHVKASLLGSSVTVPVREGSVCLGTWQGIYFGEHRSDPSGREIVLTLWGKFKGN